MFARSLKTTFTAGMLATSLALAAMTPTSASARMSDDEIAALIGLFVLGAAIHSSRDNDNVAPAPAPAPSRPNRNWQVLPASCLHDIQTRHRGTVRMFTRNCLNNNYAHANRLPDRCYIQVRTTAGQQRRGYRDRCMRTAGFRVSRR